MPIARATIPTVSASRYLQQLCKHWSHKFAVNFTPQHGTIPFHSQQSRTTIAFDAVPV